MAKPTIFDLEDFTADEGDQIHVPVCIPHGGSFRVHPDKSRVATVYLSLAGDEWTLVHPEVVNAYRVPRLWRAELFQGIWADGRSFILPVTYPRQGNEAWYESLKKAVGVARTRWVAIESDRENGCYQYQAGKKPSSDAVEWPDGDFAELVEFAFAGRIIRTRQEAEAKFSRKAARRVVLEDYEE